VQQLKNVEIKRFLSLKSKKRKRCR